jgi:hypothetical protein
VADRPYTRIYHELADEFPDLFDSPDLAGYVRLLVAADQAWPSKARWAGYVEEDEMARIEASGLVKRDGKRYTVKGLEKERRKRSSHARKAARARHEQPGEQEASTALSNIVSNAPSSAQTMPSRAEPSQDEPSRDKKNLTARDRSRGKTELKPLSDILGSAQ